MDYEEVGESYIGVLKAMAKISANIRKSDLRAALGIAKLNVTPAEAELMVDKFKGSLSFAKKNERCWLRKVPATLLSGIAENLEPHG